MAEKPTTIKSKTFLKYLLHLAIISGVLFAAFNYLDWDEVVFALGLFDLAYLVPILIISAAYVFLKGWRFIYLMRPVTDIPADVIFRGFVAGAAVTILPAGVAARVGLMGQAGVPITKSTGPVILSSLLDQIAFVLGAIISAIWFQPARLPAFILTGVILLIALAYSLQPLRKWFSKLIRWILNQVNLQSQANQFKRAWQLVAAPRVLMITFGMTLVCVLMQVVMLDLSLRGLGLVLPYPILFLAYILPAIIGRNSVIPGGFGITEAGMVGFLTLVANVDLNLGAAGVAIFRASTVIFQVFIGAVFYTFAWHGEVERSENRI
ncbi:MAG: lysylphosphatidylglycerol synthase transmembrane domain-containing protein [Anaerolineales bacterium]